MTGRTVAGVVWNYAYNTEGKLTVARKNNQLVSEYGYDGNGNRVARLGENNKGTIFIGNYFESSYPSYSIPDPPPPVVEGGSVLSDISYYYAGSQRIAMRIGNEPYLLFGDHLGSTSVVLDASGQIVEKGYYLPWGGTRGDETITSTDYAYTGQKQEGDIYYYGARWYDPDIGRFMQADTIVPLQVQGTQAFDRYAYVNNNPLRYVDPSGNFAITTAILIGAGVGALIGYAGQVIHNLNNDMSFKEALTTDISAGWIIGGAVAGGVLGGAGFAALSHFGIIQATTATTITSSGLCADGDCGNEINNGYGVLSNATDYGIDTYNKLRNVVKGSRLQVHHLIEKRFTGILGLTPEQIKKIPSVVLTREEHQVFTNAWRQLIGYSNSVNPIKTTTVTISDLIEAVNAIYEKYPKLLNESLRYLLPK